MKSIRSFRKKCDMGAQHWWSGNAVYRWHEAWAFNPFDWLAAKLSKAITINFGMPNQFICDFLTLFTSIEIYLECFFSPASLAWWIHRTSDSIIHWSDKCHWHFSPLRFIWWGKWTAIDCASIRHTVRSFNHRNLWSLWFYFVFTFAFLFFRLIRVWYSYWQGILFCVVWRRLYDSIEPREQASACVSLCIKMVRWLSILLLFNSAIFRTGRLNFG